MFIKDSFMDISRKSFLKESKNLFLKKDIRF